MDKISRELTTLYDLPLCHTNKESDLRTDPNLSKNYKIIDNSYICHKRFVIGSGSFGKVLYGTNIDKSKEYAIKFEKSTVKHSVIKEEMKILQDLSGGEGIPNIYYYGHIDDYKVLVMDLLGPSLDKFFKISDKKLTLETTVNFGIEMINRIEYVHSKNYLHRDIKPNNFLLGKYDKNFDKIDNTVYIVDFGLSKPYVDPLTNKHYEYRDNSRFVGTPRYASLNTHLGIRQSRRDDLEAIAYVLVYFLLGELPWQGIKAKTKSEKKEKIKNKKKRMSTSKLCEGLPIEFVYIVDYTKNLKFDEKPNYEYIRRLLSRVKYEFNINLNIHSTNYMWEWEHTFLESVMYYNEENFSQFNKIKKLYDKLYEGYPACSYEEYALKLKKRSDSVIINQENADENENFNNGKSNKNEMQDKNGSSHNLTISTTDNSNINSYILNSGNTPISSPFQPTLNGSGKIRIYDEINVNYSRMKVKGMSGELKLNNMG
jgi:serine/threonine protein kinase